MAKKTSLKAALASQQTRLQKNAKAKEAAQKTQKLSLSSPNGNNARTTSASKSARKVRPRGNSTMPFRPTDTILIIGDGNFSFSRALLSHSALQYLPPKNITATAYDPEELCYDKYPDARQIVDELRGRGLEVIFSVDATALERRKQIKGRRWDRVVWNFPHAGTGITDQDRNILSNQTLLLGFLKSVAPFLATGAVPSIHTPRKGKKRGNNDDSDDEGNLPEERDDMSEVEDAAEGSSRIVDRTGSRGTVLITLRNVPPYTAWNLPMLAKSPPRSDGSLNKQNPRYIQLRSFAFHREDWPGYEHRMTKGERAHGTGTTGKGGEDRTWEFCLADPE